MSKDFLPIITFLVGIIIGAVVANAIISESWCIEAVKLNHGEWITDFRGVSEFEWKEGK